MSITYKSQVRRCFDSEKIDHRSRTCSYIYVWWINRRGLSKHFQGKSQSFTSLANVMCLEDLAKPENPYNKKLKSCKSYVGLSKVLPPPTRSASSSKLFNNKPSSRTSCSSLSIGRNGSFLGLSNTSRPPSHPSHNNGATSAF